MLPRLALPLSPSLNASSRQSQPQLRPACPHRSSRVPAALEPSSGAGPSRLVEQRACLRTAARGQSRAHDAPLCAASDAQPTASAVARVAPGQPIVLPAVALLPLTALLLLAGDADAASSEAAAASAAASAATGGGGLAEAALAAVSSSGWAGPAVYVALYVAATVLLFPASVLTLAAGALYGPLYGTALVSLASTTGATAAFLVARYLARPWVERKAAELPRFRAVLAGVAANGAWVVFLLRLSPLVPFNLLNYALGLTAVPLLSYVGASWVGMLPGTFAYVALGGAGRAAVDAATSGSDSVDTVKLVLYGAGAVATIWATRLISDAATKALDQQDPKQEDGPASS